MNKVNGQTKICGIIGDPVSHSASPKMHNKLYASLEMNMIYVPFHVPSHEDVKSAVDGIKSLNMVGINVTIPHKETVIPYLDECDPLAEKIQAVNTIVNDGGRLIGYNTDGEEVARFMVTWSFKAKS